MRGLSEPTGHHRKQVERRERSQDVQMTTNTTSRPERYWHASWTIQEHAAIALSASILILAVGCATYWPGLTKMADEGRGVIHRGTLAADPDEKVRAAEAILAHADKYDQLINRSTDSRYIVEVQGIQRSEREAAALLLRTAADDYVAQQNVERARAVYHLIVESFGQKEYDPVRQSAGAALTSLGSDTSL
jgi:hypothetical protein